MDDKVGPSFQSRYVFLLHWALQSASLNKKSLHADGKPSDLTITNRGGSYKVHKAIICPQSEFFEVAANGPYLVR